MDNETFDIEIIKYGEPKRKYKMRVEIVLRSEQAVRFRVFAGARSITMEKLLLKHRGQWKIKESNFELTGNPKDIAQTILEIQNEIEYYLAGSPKWVNRFKNKQ